ncbi:MAG: biotin/lipoyl-binding protein [Turicibacter sp.]
MKKRKLWIGKEAINSFKNKKLWIGGAAVVVCLVSIAGVTLFKKVPEVERERAESETYVIPTQKKIILNGTVTPTQLKSYTKDLSKGEEVKINIEQGQAVNKGDLLLTYHSQEITDQISELKEELNELSAKKAKLTQEGTSSSKSINKQISAIDKQKTTLKQETESQVNNILKQLDSLTTQKNQLDPLDENFDSFVKEFDAQIEAYYVQKNDLEYNLPKLINELDGQIIELKDQLNESDQEAFTGIDDQIKVVSKEISKLEEKEFTYEYAAFSGNVTIISDEVGETEQLITLKSPEFCVLTTISEKDYSKVKVGMESQILVLATNKKINGIVTYIAQDPQAAPAEGSNAPIYAVKVSMEDQADLVNGYQAQVTLQLPEELIKIPTSSVINNGTKQVVYLVTENGPIEQSIEIVGEEGEYTLIKSGLNEKDEILLYPEVDGKEGEIRE